MHVRTDLLPSSRSSIRLALVAVTASTLALAAGCTDDSRWAAPNGTPVASTRAAGAPTHRASWLFTMNAGEADLAGEDGTYAVTLVEPSQVVAFTDRPARTAERLVTAWLVGAWDPLFAADPPNAVLTGLDDDGHALDAAVEVLHLTGDDSRLVATVRGIGDDRGAVLPAHLADVSLFVDDAVLVPTEATQWAYHSYVPSPKDATYLSRFRIKHDDIDPAAGDLIYSFPAEALVDGFTEQHLPALRDGGVQLHAHTAVDDGA